MDIATREEALELAKTYVEGAGFGHDDTLHLAAGLIAAHKEIERLTAALAAKAPRLTDDDRRRALDTARHIMGHDNTTAREEQLAQGLLAERAEAVELREGLGEMGRFIDKHMQADAPRELLCDVLNRINELLGAI